MRILIHMIAMILAVRKSNEVLQDNANVVLQALHFSFDIRSRCLEVEIGHKSTQTTKLRQKARCTKHADTPQGQKQNQRTNSTKTCYKNKKIRRC